MSLYRNASDYIPLTMIPLAEVAEETFVKDDRRDDSGEIAVPRADRP